MKSKAQLSIEAMIAFTLFLIILNIFLQANNRLSSPYSSLSEKAELDLEALRIASLINSKAAYGESMELELELDSSVYISNRKVYVRRNGLTGQADLYVDARISGSRIVVGS